MYKLLSILAISAVLISCKKEVDSTPENPSGEPEQMEKFLTSSFNVSAVPQTGPGTLFSGVNVSISISGMVYNLLGQPVDNADVSVNGYTTTTDAQGHFLFTNVVVDKSRAYVKANKGGYFLGAKAFKPNTSGINNVEIHLISQNTAGTFQNSSGGVVNVSNELTLVFEAGDVANEDGTAYSGNVYATASYLDPLSAIDNQKIPGDLQAIRSNGEHVVLSNYGVLAIELIGDGSEILNIAPGQSVEVRMEIPGAMQSNAPNQVPAFHFDEVQGNWSEEGTFTRVGTEYVAELEHFSFWTNGLWLPPRDFYAEIVGPTGDPILDAYVTFTGSGNEYWGSIHTDGTGILDGQIPATVDVIISVYDDCGTLLHTQNLGNGNAAINLAALTVTPSAEMGLLTGSVEDCFGNGVANATVTVEDGLELNLFLADGNGDFSVYVSHCNLSNTVTGYDAMNLVQSNSVVVASGAIMNAGVLDACTPVDQYIYLTMDGVDYSIIEFNNEVRAFRSEMLNGNPTSDSLLIEGIPFTASVGEFWFYIPSITPGTYPNCQMPYSDPLANLPDIDMLFSGTGASFDTGPNSITVDLTSYGGQGGYAEGTFSGTFTDNQGGSHTISSGQFRALIQN